MEKAGGGGHDGVAFFGLLLVAHAEVAAGALEIHHVLILGAGGGFGRLVVELEAGIFLQDVPVAFGLEFVDDVVGRRGDHERRVELDLALALLEVPKHFGDDLEVTLVNHAGTDEAEVHRFTAFVVGESADDVVGVALGDILVVDVGVGDHRLVDDVEVHDHLGVILGSGIRSERRLFPGADLSDALVGFVDQALEDAAFVVHALVDHDLNPALGGLQRFDQGFAL